MAHKLYYALCIISEYKLCITNILFFVQSVFVIQTHFRYNILKFLDVTNNLSIFYDFAGIYIQFCMTVFSVAVHQIYCLHCICAYLYTSLEG